MMLPYFYDATCGLFPFCSSIKHPTAMYPTSPPPAPARAQLPETPRPGSMRQELCFQVCVNRDSLSGDSTVSSKNPK